MTSRDWRRTGDCGAEHGTAMLEFVMSLPFIFIILVLVFNFGQGYLERQRALVAVREMAMRHGEQVAGGNAAIEGIGRQLSRDTLERRGMRATFTAPHSGGCPRGGEGSADPAVREAFRSGPSGMRAFLSRVSGTQIYEASLTGRPLTGRLLDPATYAPCLAIDGHTWTYGETGGLGGMIRSVMPGWLGFLGRIF